MMWLYALVGLASVVVLFYLKRRWVDFRYWEKHSLPGPPPHWLFGNYYDFADVEKSRFKLVKWAEKYGKIFAFYEASNPSIFVSDVNAVHEVMVKHFDNFHVRKVFPFAHDPQDVYGDMLTTDGKRWKRIRNIGKMCFTANRLKVLLSIVSDCGKRFFRRLDQGATESKPVEILTVYQHLTAETIMEAGFGVELHKEGESEDLEHEHPFVVELKKTFAQALNVGFFMVVGMSISELQPLWDWMNTFLAKNFYKGYSGSLFKLMFFAERLVDERIKQKVQREDMMQLMVSYMKSPEEVEKLRHTDEAGWISKQEVAANAMIFFIAGYETSSNSLAFLTYELARNIEVQEQLRNEIMTAFPGRSNEDMIGSVEDVKTLDDMEYLHQVVMEGQRIYPVGQLVVGRNASKACTVGGVPIRAGQNVNINVEALHFDAELWGPEDVYEFAPARWEKERHKARHPMAFQAFGTGPRQCVGMRLGLLEVKLTIVNLLQRYRVELAPSQKVPLPVVQGDTLQPKDGVTVILHKLQ